MPSPRAQCTEERGWSRQHFLPGLKVDWLFPQTFKATGLLVKLVKLQGGDIQCQWWQLGEASNDG